MNTSPLPQLVRHIKLARQIGVELFGSQCQQEAILEAANLRLQSLCAVQAYVEGQVLEKPGAVLGESDIYVFALTLDGSEAVDAWGVCGWEEILTRQRGQLDGTHRAASPMVDPEEELAQEVYGAWSDAGAQMRAILARMPAYDQAIALDQASAPVYPSLQRRSL